MAVTYYVALPFIRTEEGVAAGQAQEMPSEGAAIRRAEAMSRDTAHIESATARPSFPIQKGHDLPLWVVRPE